MLISRCNELKRRAQVDEVAVKTLLPLDDLIVNEFSETTILQAAMVSELSQESFCLSMNPILHGILLDAWENRPTISKRHLRALR